MTIWDRAAGKHRFQGFPSPRSQPNERNASAACKATLRRYFGDRRALRPRRAWLQGGGALGACQVGVYQALAEAGCEPNWISGVSIGAINSANL
jgi:Patatin-like phospholipase